MFLNTVRVLVCSLVFPVSYLFSQNTSKLHENNAIPPLEHAYFASGCFWCVEVIFESLVGVTCAESGYAGGHVKNPTYKQVSKGSTGHSETVHVIFNPKIISYQTLVDVYYATQDPTTFGQSPDIGTPYRSMIFTTSDEQHQIVSCTKKKLQRSYSKKILTEIKDFEHFWKAEAYHQDFERRNPNHPYVKRVSKRRFHRFAKLFPHLIKKEYLPTDLH